MLVFVFAFFTSRGLQADDREWHVCNQPSKEEYSKEGKNTKKATTRRK
jgi:preprotein translocase subunit Sss1